MMSRLAIGSSFALAMLAPAVAAQPAPANPALGEIVGNTLNAAYEEGTGAFKLRADGTWTAKFPSGQPGSGHWVADSKYLCFITLDPKPPVGDATRCEQISAAHKKIGQSWKIVDSYGKPVTLTIIKGQ